MSTANTTAQENHSPKGNRVSNTLPATPTASAAITRSLTDEEVCERLHPDLMAHKRAVAKLERPKERAALGKLQEQVVDTKPNVRLRPTQNSTSAFPEYPDDTNYPMYKLELLLMEMLGPDIDFVRGFLAHLAEGCTHGGLVDDRELNFAFSTIKLLKPRDPLEAMAAGQLAVLHGANMRIKQDVDDAEKPEERQSAYRTLAQGMRAYMSMMQEFRKYRTGGEQRVIVQHQTVSVAQGAQAIVGQLAHASASEGADAPAALPEPQQVMPAITHASAVPMPVMAARKQSVMAEQPVIGGEEATTHGRAQASHDGEQAS